MSQHRRDRRSQPGHADDWLITYADTITLLLCLFIVLLVSQTHRPAPTPAPIPAAPAEPPVASGHFVDWIAPVQPITLSTEAPDDDASAGAEAQTARQDASLPLKVEPVPPQPSDPPAASVVQPVLAPTAQEPQQVSVAPPVPLTEIAAQMAPEGTAHLEQKGDRITTLAFDSAAFFSRGAATLNSSGKVILREVVGNLKSEEYRDYMITIEGHTDDEPINTTQFPSNWELSTARAVAVVRFFVEQGVPAQRIRAAGYADTQPLQPNRDGSGMAIPENQAKNRRVVIELEKVEHH